MSGPTARRQVLQLLRPVSAWTLLVLGNDTAHRSAPTPLWSRKPWSAATYDQWRDVASVPNVQIESQSQVTCMHGLGPSGCIGA